MEDARSEVATLQVLYFAHNWIVQNGRNGCFLEQDQPKEDAWTENEALTRACILCRLRPDKTMGSLLVLSLQEDVERASSAHARELSEYENDIATFQQRLVSAKQLLDKDNQAIADYEARMIAHESEMERLRKDRQHAEEDKTALEESARETSQEVEHLSRRIVELT